MSKKTIAVLGAGPGLGNHLGKEFGYHGFWMTFTVLPGLPLYFIRCMKSKTKRISHIEVSHEKAIS